MKIVLPGEHPISWNHFYSGRHWTYRRIIAEALHQKIALALYEQKITFTNPRLFETQVDITIIAYYRKSHIDSDNIPAKLYIDGMKGLLLKDDSPHYVGWVRTKSEKTTEQERLEITISEALAES